MARQAARFGQAGLARAAEIVSTGLDQMRGATSPRLLLELMCAQVLLPAAATDEKSLLARLERLEKGTPSTVPQSPRRPPQPAPDDGAERARVPSPAARPRAPAAGTAPGPRARPPGPRRNRPNPPGPRLRPPGRHPKPRAAARGRRRRRRPRPPRPRRPRRPPAASAVDSLRQSWAAILEAVKQERKVAWMLLSNASVLSLEDGILTLRFSRDGELKGFSVSGHDAVLKRVLSTDFGLNVTIKGVAGGRRHGRGRPAGTARTRSPGGSPPPAVRRDPVPAPSESAPPEFAAPDFAEPTTSRTSMPPGDEPRGRAVTGRPGGPERRTDRHGPDPA